MVSLQKAGEIEGKLGENVWLGGQQPSKDDAEAFTSIGGAPDAGTHPQAAAWYFLVGKFTDAVRGSWTAAAAGGAKEPKKAEAGGKGKEKAKAAAPEKAPDQAAAEGGLSKADAKKAAKEAQKAAKEAKKQERLRKRQEEEAERNKFVKDPNDPCTD